MLKQRIITAVILAPLVLAALFLLPPVGFAWFTGFIFLLGGWEWSRLAGLASLTERLIFLLLLVLTAVLAYLQSPKLVLFIAALWWFVCFGMLFFYSQHPRTVWLHSSGVLGWAGVMTLVPCWLSLNYLRHMDQFTTKLLILLLAIWAADIAAYFVGKRWGQRKLAPIISPGKSWEGCYGAVLFTGLCALIYSLFKGYNIAHILGFTILIIGVVLFSIVGDLFESTVKRLRGVKDSGLLLPGHGGILDRIDSLTAAAPIFTLGILLWFN